MVVQAITRLNVGGPARHVLDLAAGLDDRYSMRIAAGTPPTVEGELPTDGLHLDRLPMVRPIAPHRDAAALIGMRRLLRRHQAQLVHSHMAKAGAVARLAAASMRPRPRTVHTFHGHVLSGYFRPRIEQGFAEVERRLARQTDVLVTVSEEIRDALLDLGIGRPSQYEVVPLGVDLDPYLAVRRPTGRLRGELAVGQRTPVVAVVARLAPIKDHRTLFEAMKKVPDAHLAVFGDGELRSELGWLARDLGIDDRTHFLGWREDLADWLADVDIVSLSSRNEGTPMALIEAAAACRAIVATDVGGVADVVVNGRTGLLSRPGDADMLSGQIERLLGDPALAIRLGQQAREHVRDRFGLDRSLDRLARLYQTVLHGEP